MESYIKSHDEYLWYGTSTTGNVPVPTTQSIITAVQSITTGSGLFTQLSSGNVIRYYSINHFDFPDEIVKKEPTITKPLHMLIKDILKDMLPLH